MTRSVAHAGLRSLLRSALALSGLAVALSQPGFAGVPSSCRALLQAGSHSSSLPERVPVGVENILFDLSGVVTVYAPIDGSGPASGRIGDTNANPLPDRFVVGDGTLSQPFVGVDARPGRPLQRCLQLILAELQERVGHAPSDEDIIRFVRDMNAPSNGPGKSPVLALVGPEGFGWSEKLLSAKEREKANAAFAKLGKFVKGAGGKMVPAFAVGIPVAAKIEFPVRPLDDFLIVGKGVCLQKAVLGALLLREAGIDVRLINGRTEQGGHTWLELPDGRVLDPTWNVLDQKHTEGAWPGWFRYGQTFVQKSPVYPYLELAPATSAAASVSP